MLLTPQVVCGSSRSTHFKNRDPVQQYCWLSCPVITNGWVGSRILRTQAGPSQPAPLLPCMRTPSAPSQLLRVPPLCSLWLRGPPQLGLENAFSLELQTAFLPCPSPSFLPSSFSEAHFDRSIDSKLSNGEGSFSVKPPQEMEKMVFFKSLKEETNNIVTEGRAGRAQNNSGNWKDFTQYFNLESLGHRGGGLSQKHHPGPARCQPTEVGMKSLEGWNWGEVILAVGHLMQTCSQKPEECVCLSSCRCKVPPYRHSSTASYSCAPAATFWGQSAQDTAMVHLGGFSCECRDRVQHMGKVGTEIYSKPKSSVVLSHGNRGCGTGGTRPRTSIRGFSA